MDKKTEIIASSLLFNGLPEDQLKAVSAIAIEKRFGRNEDIFFEGDKADGFYMVADGRVKIYKMSFDGKEQILHIYGGGEPFGEVPVFNGRPYPANAVSLVKTTTFYFPRKEFVGLVRENSDLALNMLGMLSLRLRQFAHQVELLSLKEVPGRLASYLVYLAEEQGRQDKVTLDIPKGQLASLLGTIPETLSRIFAKMSEEGLIKVEGKEIYLQDLEGLRER
ncbi:MAG: Crp/Fnr family transcriptional regulator [Desulfobulbaceae bacterium]|nr:Crp/Fnr family transcriptional regulator [Desulfobulbaceae bacterium]